MDRTTRPKPTVTVDDLSKPLPDLTGEGCFGKMWDLTTIERRLCQDKLLCGAKFRTHQSAEVSTEKYLDQQDLTLLTDNLLFNYIESGVTTQRDFIEYCMIQSKALDRTAIINFLKRWLKANALKVQAKDGKLWLV